MTAREKILYSDSRKQNCALSPHQTTEAANWIRDRMAIEELLLNRYISTFQNYVWTDAHSAIYLMNAEVITLRKECADELSRRNSLHRTLIQACEALECTPPDSNGLGCAPLCEALNSITSEIPGRIMFDMAANLHKKLFPRVNDIDGDSPRMIAIMDALACARTYGRGAA